jgi:hypothetical protein
LLIVTEETSPVGRHRISAPEPLTEYLDGNGIVAPPRIELVIEPMSTHVGRCSLLVIKLVRRDAHLLNADLISFGQHTGYDV